jgi:glycosyltransferase involved in cell wall biosynthesis
MSARVEASVVPCVLVVLLNYNGAQVTLDCVRSVAEIDYPNVKVVVVGNASTDGSARVLAEGIAAINDSCPCACAIRAIMESTRRRGLGPE